ncbi:hypothetical protein AKJ44_00290 [candidate division MSBL1 archaeon SCGC-AAA261F17]|uniref:SpoVT-AbrB domain-containing protein n=1 Tax=candidate division MSBL1 archaeon SCGC-AAA261F17 TaxID=1698274 RepID=A0A133V7Q0_9EURY|nr:hypothetical protein AKJ44_00290 [candidate division MSBL1 archaeon SCGC-AAA261F17]
MRETVTLDSRGRLLLPAEIRRELGTQRFILKKKGGKLELEPLPAPESVKSKHKKLIKVSLEELEETQEKFIREGRR